VKGERPKRVHLIRRQIGQIRKSGDELFQRHR
jgi:hypothetical protein